MRPGRLNLITDVAGLRVGNASDSVMKSGVTCLTADLPFAASVDIRGGAPGTREMGLLEPDKTVAAIDALVLSGGSAFGLDSAGGVVDGLVAAGRGFAVGAARVPIVPAAILFDLASGGAPDRSGLDYRNLGRAAYDAAGEDFDLGSVGAGTGATTARLKGGLGSASWVLESGHIVGALVAANPVGNVTYPDSRHFLAWAEEQGSEYGGLGPPDRVPGPLSLADTKHGGQVPDRASTTIGIVATDAPLDKAALKRLAVAAHDGYARAIAPAHTPMDGDLIFALSTATGAPADTPVEHLLLGHAAATAMSRAIARAIYLARPAPGDVKPCYADLG